ncbi:hypothetical protein [Actinoplanes derwentensis]|uniref:Uncharacterized protein n=1 Tax=Actinoplanes derwentensis TaxID=113562 RepID=A0A1H1ZK60_9ACTN|nr:hypothetical protein [Actinoplanes derwentensis]GID82488.1 hypothetical protein Ade03nite_14120 [Actinoplanes derwentensis]SDT34185.1 hypothetical protein SAMN04489716_3368 [Actinoplanes derwentensis]
MKSLTFRAVSGVIAGSILFTLPGTATAAVRAPAPPWPLPGAGHGVAGKPLVNAGMGSNPALSTVRKKRSKPVRSTVDKPTGRSAESIPGELADEAADGTEHEAADGTEHEAADGTEREAAGGVAREVAAGAVREAAAGAVRESVGVGEARPRVVEAAGEGSRKERRGADLAFRVSVPGATASGVYAISTAPAETRRGVKGKGSPALSVSLKVTGRTRCGVLQMTTNGPADGIEWYTFAVLCKPGTATFRTEATRLPWSSGTLPSVRICNGLSPALAEGDDCDDFEPPRGS